MNIYNEEKNLEKREAKLQSELVTMIDNKFRSLEDNIHRLVMNNPRYSA
jgi:hypothetical protein